MAILTINTITKLSPGLIRVSFTGTGYVYLNGVLAYGPCTDSADITVGDASVYALEVHDLEAIPPIYQQTNIRPLIKWTAVPGESPVSYRVYIQPSGGSEALVHVEPYAADVTFYQVQAPAAIAGGWAFVRVKAVSSAGLEATVAAWPLYIYDLPTAADDLEISGTGGVFTLTIT